MDLRNVDFSRLFSLARPYKFDPDVDQSLSRHGVDRLQRQLESDRGRIIASAAIRRLQQKTQVFPLERNAAVRTRLTHSLEVQQNGRYIVKTLFEKLGDQVQACGLDGLQGACESLVEMACLLHDVGNPPFGHFGEGAIIDWSRKNLPAVFERLAAQDASQQALKQRMQMDLQHFEGNAQAIRLVTSLQRMNLTFVQTAAILKYTRPAWQEKSPDHGRLQKKPGFYLSEQDYIDSLHQALNMTPGARHPLAYVMEAADDIAYCLADIEDSVEKDILTIARLHALLLDTFTDIGGDAEAADFSDAGGRKRSYRAVLDYALKRSQDEAINKSHEYFVWLRVGLIHNLIDHAAQRFVDHLAAMHRGDFQQGLLEDDSPFHKVVQTFKRVGHRHVFNHPEVQTLEIQGYRIIFGLLDIYGGLLNLTSAQFTDLLNGTARGPLLESRLFNRLGNKYVKAYQVAVQARAESHPEAQPLWELYHRCRLIQDHVSGMTDQFAFDEYKTLTVSN